MRKLHPLLVVTAFALAFISCEEEPVGVILTPETPSAQDTTYVLPTVPAAQQRMVLLEDFTGVRCGNCPKGHDEIKSILAANPGRVAAVGAHPFNILVAFPITEDFRTQEANQVLDIIGNPLGLPFGAIDRVNMSGVTTLWANEVSKRLPAPTLVNVDASILTYNEASRELSVKVVVTVTGNVTGNMFVTVGLTENGIISPQVDDRAHGTVQDYVHNHLLRRYFVFARALNPGGSPALEPGRVFERVFTVTLGDSWKRENCYIVALAHLQKEVLQTTEIPAK